MSEKEKMLAGLPYKDSDPELLETRFSVRNLLHEFNNRFVSPSERIEQLHKIVARLEKAAG